MATNPYTFEQVDRIVSRANLRQFRAGGRAHVTARTVAVAPGDVLPKLCSIWAIVGPIVTLIMGLPLIPKKWKEALKIFAGLMDTVCKAS
jgi:hypothetical protein